MPCSSSQKCSSSTSSASSSSSRPPGRPAAVGAGGGEHDERVLVGRLVGRRRAVGDRPWRTSRRARGRGTGPRSAATPWSTSAPQPGRPIRWPSAKTCVIRQVIHSSTGRSSSGRPSSSSHANPPSGWREARPNVEQPVAASSQRACAGSPATRSPRSPPPYVRSTTAEGRTQLDNIQAILEIDLEGPTFHEELAEDAEAGSACR